MKHSSVVLLFDCVCITIVFYLAFSIRLGPLTSASGEMIFHLRALVPLLLIAILVYAGTSMSAIRTQARPAILQLPAGHLVRRVRAAVAAAAVPEQYRSILNLRELELAAAGARPVLWLTALIALAFAVTR